MIPISAFPTINATLNLISGMLLATGYIFIRQKKITAHKTCMISSFIVSIFFLSCYLYYHYHHGSTRFLGQGFIKIIYFFILTSHVILAIFILPMAAVTLYRAWRGNFIKHVKIARRTFPLWMYVSVTGVIVYLMLYHLR